MAESYESTAADVIGSLESSDLSTATKDAITSLINDLAAADQAPVVASFATGVVTAETLAATAGAEAANIIMMSGDSSADISFAADSPVQAITVGAGGNSNIQFETEKDVTVALQGGEGDTVATGAGNDTITIQGGSATVDTGSGNDTVAITGGDAEILGGDGNLVVDIAAGAAGNATIDGGLGFDLVKIVSSVVEHTFQFVAGKFIMNSDFELDMANVNVVGFDSSGDGLYNTATVLADTAAESLVGKLYNIALGRTETGALDGDTTNQMGGIEFWTETYPSEDAESSLAQTVYSFLNCEEFHSKYDVMNNEQYVTTLFENMGLAADATIGGKSLADYVSAIDGNADQNIARYDVAWAIAASEEAVQVLGADGQKFVIDADGLDLGNPLA